MCKTTRRGAPAGDIAQLASISRITKVHLATAFYVPATDGGLAELETRLAYALLPSGYFGHLGQFDG
jgi:hypothetical protein